MFEHYNLIYNPSRIENPVLLACNKYLQFVNKYKEGGGICKECFIRINTINVLIFFDYMFQYRSPVDARFLRLVGHCLAVHRRELAGARLVAVSDRVRAGSVLNLFIV